MINCIWEPGLYILHSSGLITKCDKPKEEVLIWNNSYIVALFTFKPKQ